MFRFKKFVVDQSGCAMKINTDGVLIGAITKADNPLRILDIGTGTGVIALMLAQKFINAKIYAVEIDETAAQTAARNFTASPFGDRMTIFAGSFENYFNQFPKIKYDLIISNPPFYINSLKSPGTKKALAKHSDADFFETFISNISAHLTPCGYCWIIVPVTIAGMITHLAANEGVLPQQFINVYSYSHSLAHRVIICLGFSKSLAQTTKFTIYSKPGSYTDQYKKFLQPYFIDY